ncbi:antirestriction protein ArdA [Chryseobacterium polytrichastri]|uniref:Antirestriction protein n=1 Tax=Chryseobacterium polytrichastri TaxID=1302687 RepID=A0A1M6TAL1_9FLAO|nr:antirestriction protein ArdA [Chryseobacterium polytrichastri]SHK53788.1 Antirestriction protein [Chryseobacterium polytrichastri]
MTKLQNCLYTASIYCGTYRKYNNGSLYGEWLNLSDYSDYDELLTAMYELHNNESDPEFMFQDYEHCELFEKLGLISECHLSKDIYEIIEQINDSGHDLKVFEAYIDCIGKMDFNSLYDGVINNYIGEYSDDEIFAQYMLEESIPESLPNYVYIDWETTARNLMFDYYSSGGYYFRG